MKRILGPTLLILLVIGVAVGIFFSVKDALFSSSTLVTGLIGSEKKPFFEDPRVIDRLNELGLEVHAQKAGSREIATSFDLTGYDFAWPAGVPAAEKMRHEHGVSKFYNVFFTPMAFASWVPIAEMLEAEGVAEDHDGYYTVDLEGLYGIMVEERRWSDLALSSRYPVDKGILVTTTDVRRSNSAAMYLSLMSYVINGNSIVSNPSEADEVLEEVSQLFLRQGYVEYSSAAPFNDYLVMGMGKAPLVNIYEAQFIAAAAEGRVSEEMVLMYPEPTIFSKHIFVPFSDGGKALGEALRDDPELRRLAIEHGFRNDDMDYFRSFTEERGIVLPSSIVDVVETPSYEIVEGMIQQIERMY